MHISVTISMRKKRLFPSSSLSTMMLLLLLLLLATTFKTDGYIGVNWGRQSSQRLIPSMVVDLLLQNNIRDVRLFTLTDRVLQAFAGSGIRMVYGIPNTSLKNFANVTATKKWVEEKITANPDTIVRYVAVGTEPFSVSIIFNQRYDNAVDVLKLIQSELNSFGSDIKATIPHFTDVLTLNNTSKPSEVDFKPEIKHLMLEVVRFLKENNAPFMLVMFPIMYVNDFDLDAEFAFMDNKSNFTIKDVNGLVYRNVFEYLYDSCHWALAKAGAGDMPIVVSSIGWPTDGYPGANVDNAERFYKSFLPYIKSNKGTPMRPGASIDIYMHSLSDENRIYKGIGGVHRHWGLYESTGEPKYKIDFSGEGRDIYPTTAIGISRMPKRWCVFNGNTEDLAIIDKEFQSACEASDCSSLELGGSCSNLSYHDKISYSFNRQFQMEAQAVGQSSKLCYMNGLGKVVLDDPSNGTCIFPIEILSAEVVVRGVTFGRSSRVSAALSPLLLSTAIIVVFLIN